MVIAVDDGFIIIGGENYHPKNTRNEWELLTQTKKGFTKWVLLKGLKEINPVKISKYVVINKIY